MPIFLGPFCPEAVGDYIAGPNHVLPTGRTARFASGLAVHDFLKRTTWVARPTRQALEKHRPRRGRGWPRRKACTAHARSVALRLENAGPTRA